MEKINVKNNKLDLDYQALLQDILDNGHQKGDRTGTGTISVFGRQIRYKMSEGFPLLTTKKMYFKGIVTELLWFLRGDTNIKFLVDNDCHIWDGDAWKNYQNKASKEDFLKDGVLRYDDFINKIKTNDEFANKWGELGPVYGKQWRSWVRGVDYDIDYENGINDEIDQIANLIHDLKTNPDSRRLMVSAWNVGELGQMTLPPCHYGFQVYTRELTTKERLKIWISRCTDDDYKQQLEEVFNDWDNPNWAHGVFETDMDDAEIPTRAISLMWNQRSVDTFLGLPFNIASYGLLLEIIAKAVNMVPDELIGNLGDTHLYLNHIEQAKEQIGREFTHEERTEMLKESMCDKAYNEAISELIPFGGGMSEYYESYNIPRRTREPYPLPILDIHPGILDYDLDKLEISMFKILDYQSHPRIKAQISN